MNIPVLPRAVELSTYNACSMGRGSIPMQQDIRAALLGTSITFATLGD